MKIAILCLALAGCVTTGYKRVTFYDDGENSVSIKGRKLVYERKF